MAVSAFDLMQEIIRLRVALADTEAATKCAGLQGKIDDLTADVEHYKSGLTSAIETIKSLERLCDQLGEALQNCANNEDDVMLTRDALEAWRAMK